MTADAGVLDVAAEELGVVVVVGVEGVGNVAIVLLSLGVVDANVGVVVADESVDRIRSRSSPCSSNCGCKSGWC